MDSVDLAFVYLLLVRDIHNNLSRHQLQYGTFIPFLKQITITKNNRIFSFLYIVFYWKNNLELCFSLADTGVKGLLKY